MGISHDDLHDLMEVTLKDMPEFSVDWLNDDTLGLYIRAFDRPRRRTWYQRMRGQVRGWWCMLCPFTIVRRSTLEDEW